MGMEQDWAERYEAGPKAAPFNDRFLITPSDAPEGASIIGCVSATVVKGTGPVSTIFSAFTDFFGRRSGAYEEKLRTSLSEALMELQSEAEGMGASAVFNMRYQVFEATSGHGQLVVVAYGTAVR